MICAHFFTQCEKAYFVMTFLSQIVTADEPEPIILNRRQKGAGQGMLPTGHTRTCLSLAEGCRCGRRLYKK
jgi:hypothetical protein